MEKYVKELTNTMIALTKGTGRMLEQEHFRMINMVTAINPGGLGGKEAIGSPRMGSWSTRS